jgi:hypothetical protein
MLLERGHDGYVELRPEYFFGLFKAVPSSRYGQAHLVQFSITLLWPRTGRLWAVHKCDKLGSVQVEALLREFQLSQGTQ